MPEPVWLVDVEAFGPPPALPARRYERAAVAVHVHGELVGVVELPLAGLDGAALVRRATAALREPVIAHLRADETDAPCTERRARLLERAPFASVVVASRDGGASLGACLDSLLALDYPGYEVIVVDNASQGDTVRDSVAARAGAPRALRRVREERPGVAVAHNRGLAEASGEIVAFTDDDVVAEPSWLAQLASGFEAAPGVGCVTGLILPAELETSAQVWIEHYWAFGKGFERQIFDARPPAGQRLYPYTAGVFGSGANMAFRADALREIGGFDPALGTGSPALGGDDLAAFFDIIAAGHRLVYEPTAVVRHRHRPDYASLRRQAYGYGVGLTAYLARTLVDDPRRALELSRRAPWAMAYVLAPGSPKNARGGETFPAELKRLERRGMAVGAFAYLRSRWQRRTLYAGAAG
jgi:cellulose synthase/poly-beta-1,6-N-acetylglucosamine synthase-like glycosyltransferase